MVTETMGNQLVQVTGLCPRGCCEPIKPLRHVMEMGVLISNRTEYKENDDEW
jgi:hypothetical protein